MRAIVRTLVFGVLLFMPLLVGACGNSRGSRTAANPATQPAYNATSSTSPTTGLVYQRNSSNQTMEILVWANGPSAEAARGNAFRQAVERVCGVYLDAQTISRNRQIIEDEVLRLANGFVESYDVIQELNRGSEIQGQYRVRVRVEPLMGTFVSRIADQLTVDASSITAAVNSQLERNRNILAGLSRMLQDHPTRSVSVVPVDFGLASEVGLSDDVDVYVDVAVQWNQLWLYRFSKFLEQAETPNTPIAFYWASAGQISEQYTNSAPPRQSIPAPVVFRTQAAFNMNCQKAHLPEAISQELAKIFTGSRGREVSSRIVVKFRSRGGLLHTITSRCGPMGIASNRGPRIAALAEPYMTEGERYRTGRPLNLFSSIVNSSEGATTDSLLLISRPDNQTLGLGRKYRVQAKIPASLLESIDEIVAEVENSPEPYPF